ncbi:ATP-binding protein [Streptomyces samsunensis]|uniref:ATP-binding protein n=1 Tax=Streptomyces malaysiensis TaxID=92644 RepID=UPI0015822AD7|nr:ATP-binding protein [Streptomyces samsunensis]NUH40143.1 ATP-binding protein [Streptomyces samsunensis]
MPLSLPAQERYAPIARRHVAGRLLAWGISPADQDSVLLIIGELAANAAKHGRESMTIMVTASSRSLTIEVTDTGTPTPANPQQPSEAEGENGRGLQIVECLARSVQYIADSTGTRVRVDYALATAAPSPGTDRPPHRDRD